MNTNRNRWSWRSCFAVVKYNKNTRNQHSHQLISQKDTLNVNTHIKHVEKLDEHSNFFKTSTTPQNGENTNDKSYLISPEIISNEYDQFTISSSCIIKVEPSSSDNEKNLISRDSIQQVIGDDIDLLIIYPVSSSVIRPIYLDAIVEDFSEETFGSLEKSIQTVRLYCDREIVDNSNDLHSRLFDLSQMNHVKTQFKEYGNLLDEFLRQIDKLKQNTDYVVRASVHIPRDAELLEARYSTLLATIESLSLLLKIGQIPACRSLIKRLVFSIEQRMQQLNKLVQITSISFNNSQQQQQRDINDDDFLSFRSALSSHEHLFMSS